MIKKEVFTGFLVGLIANGLGLFLASLILGKGEPFTNVIKAAAEEGFLGKLISIGAILNLMAFFAFIKQKKDYRARGVLLATVFIAVLTFMLKFR